jgi:large subunit ribosomal protein L18
MNRSKSRRRATRHLRIRKKVLGTEKRPRLVVFRSDKHIYASLVNDEIRPNKVFFTVSSRSKAFMERVGEKAKGGNVEAGRHVGTLAAEKAKEQGVAEVVFDRGGYKYSGRVRALAEGARQGGLKF